jgi:Flp pilus assembly protein TadG
MGIVHTTRRRDRTALVDDRGAAVVEFAIIFPVLIILLFGMIDFGRAFFLRNNLVAAVREGARFAAVALAPPCSNTAPIVARTQQYMTNIGGASPTVTVANTGGCAAGVTTNMTVSIVNYQFTPITPVFRLINYNASLLRINVSATYRWESSP